MDPQRAAKARAQARKRPDGTASAAASSRGILDEIADAEEDYEEPEEVGGNITELICLHKLQSVGLSQIQIPFKSPSKFDASVRVCRIHPCD